MANSCADIDTARTASDRLAKVHSLLDEMGLGAEENLLDLSNNLYKMTVEINTAVKSKKMDLECTQFWASYVVSRQGGFSPEESAGAVVEMATSVYTVIE